MRFVRRADGGAGIRNEFGFTTDDRGYAIRCGIGRAVLWPEILRFAIDLALDLGDLGIGEEGLVGSDRLAELGGLQVAEGLQPEGRLLDGWTDAPVW